MFTGQGARQSSRTAKSRGVRRERDASSLVRCSSFVRMARLGVVALILWLALFGRVPSATADEHWSFRRLSIPAVPLAAPSAEVRTPVDAFIADKLHDVGLRFAPSAERETWLRRVSLDLRGIPPTIEERDAWLADQEPDAASRLVDRLLASPQHGPRWAKYWLDAAGYADSNGYFSADTDRPLAWQYRDYVVGVHNADRPFDEFVREQLAGDELSGYDPMKTPRTEWAEALIATHYLRNAPDGTGESDGNPDEVRVDRYTVLEGTLQILGASLLGLTVQCARCHDHKFEPLTQRDYYQLQAFFYPAYNVEQWLKPNDRVVQLGDRKIAWLTDPSPHPPEVALLVRGDPKERGERVSPDVPAALRDEQAPLRLEPPPARRTTGRRLALARWITHPGSRAEGVLARVTVNRMWQHHFVQGLVSTPENLGVTGATPTHASLLEFLAANFVASGWSMKRVHREIVLSTTYAQTSATSAAARRADPNNQWLSRYPLHRLDADALRDSLLVAVHDLDWQLGGPFVPTKRSSVGEVAVESKPGAGSRRSMYLQQRRTQTDSFLAVFDAPSIVASCPQRASTTTPLQSLAQLNSRFVRARAESAARNARDSQPSASEPLADVGLRRWATALFRGVMTREPNEDELAASLEFIRAQCTEYGVEAAAFTRVATDYCQMLLASNAFLYVE